MYLRVLGRILHTILQTAAYNSKIIPETPAKPLCIAPALRHIAASPFCPGKNHTWHDLRIMLIIKEMFKMIKFCKHLSSKVLQGLKNKSL